MKERKSLIWRYLFKKDSESFYSEYKKEDLKLVFNSGTNLLTESIIRGNTEIAKFLVKEGIDVNYQTKNKNTALHLVAGIGNQDTELAQLLLNAGADINIKDKYGNTPLWVATFYCKGKNYDMVKLFMKNGAIATSKNLNGKSPLDFAKQIENEKLIRILE